MPAPAEQYENARCIRQKVTFRLNSGIQPSELSGERTGLYWGSCFVEVHRDYEDPFRVPNIIRSMASRVTNYFNIKGPTVHTDTACNSSLNAVNEAFLAVRTGLIDRAIVAGSNTCFRPMVSQRFRDLKMINKDGTCKCLDKSADGYCRSEAIVVILIERKDMAKRIYAKIRNSKSGSDGYKEEGITFPSMSSQCRLARETYEEAGIDPADIGYIEAHVTGTAAGDPVEMEAMYNLICAKKKDPLLVGCVKSSIGHAEGGSGLASVAKALIVLQKRLIPPNIHFKESNPNIRGLTDGKMRPVTEITALPGSLIPVNSFGFGGANTHVVLEGYFEDRSFKPVTHRLVCVCGRTLESISHMVQAISDQKSFQTPDFLSLIDNYSRFEKMGFRGFMILSDDHVLHTFATEVKPAKVCIVFNNVTLNDSTDPSFEEQQVFLSKKNQVVGVSDAISSQLAWSLILRDMGVQFDKVIGIGTGQIAADLLEAKIGLKDAIKLAQHPQKLIDTETRLNGILSGYVVVEANQHGLRILTAQSAVSKVSNLDSTLMTLGQLFCRGISMKIAHLYPDVEYPLPSSTPTLSSLIEWDHRQTFSIAPYLVQTKFIQKETTFKYHFDRRNVDDAFLYDHQIDERILFPATGYLMVAWVTFSKLRAQSIFESPIEFSNVSFSRATVMNKGRDTTLSVRLDASNGSFVVTESETVVVTGTLKNWTEKLPDCKTMEQDQVFPDQETTLSARNIYKEFRVRGYDYGPCFQGLFEAAPNGSTGNLIWRDVIPKVVMDALTLEVEEEWDLLWLRSWVAFVDAVFQLDILNSQNDTRSLFVPTRVTSIICDPDKLRKNVEKSKKFLDAVTMSQSSLVTTRRGFGNTIFTEGLIVKGLKTTFLKRRQQKPSFFNYEFRPFFGQNVITTSASQKLRQYLSTCNAALQAPDLRHSFDLSDKRFSLLKNITTGSDDPLVQDLLLGQTECTDQFLYPLLDTAVSTLHMPYDVDNPFDILEVSASSQLLGPKILDLWPAVLLFNAIKLTYTALHPNPEDLASVSGSDITLSKGKLPEKSKRQHLVLYKCCSEGNQAISASDVKAVIKSAYECLHDGGYMWIVFEQEPDQSSPILSSLIKKFTPGRQFMNQQDLTTFAEETGFLTIRDVSVDPNVTLKGLLFRKVEVDTSTLTHRVIQVGLENYDNWFEDLKLFMREENEYKDKRLWIVPKIQDVKYQATGIIGLVKSLKLEEGGERLRTLVDFSVQTIDIHSPKYRDIIRKDMVYNVFDCETQQWGCPQSMYFSQEKEDQPVTNVADSYLRCLKPGDLTTLTWVQDKVHEEQARSKNKMLIDVAYSALNFRDIMFASGQLDSDAIPGIHSNVVQDSILGLEFSGTDQHGKRVMGIIPYRGLATKITTDCDNDFVWPVPDDWSLEQAASVPVVYATAYYALIVRGGLSTGDSLLIHSGCGGVGLAALSIALSMKCKVFATCGSDEKKKYLLNRHPELEGQIFNSRDTRFEEQIMIATDGYGVDAVLNSLAEDKLQASIRCLAPSGRFLEIGKVDFIKDHPMFMYQMSENRSFHGILLDALFHYEDSRTMTDKVCFDKKRLRALLLQGISDGVVKPLDATIFSPQDVEHAFRFMASGKHIGKVLVRVRDDNSNVDITCFKSMLCHPTKAYIVLGGLGGFGMEIVYYLVSKGAVSIMISSRSGVRDPYQRYCVSRLEQKGIKVLICKADITKESGCQQLLEETVSQTGLPIGGIFNTAVVYNDCLYQDQYVSQFRSVCGPKAEATRHLDKLSRKMCPELDHFVTFSSISANRGNAGQSNYNFANSVMDSICQERRRVGLPALSVQWGVVGDVGIVAETANSNDMVLLGSRSQRMHSCLEAMDTFLQSEYSVCLSYIKADPDSSKKEDSQSVDILSVIMRLLGLKDVTAMDPEITLGGLGVDSLIAVEIKQALDKCSGSSISIKEVRNLSIATLIRMSEQQQQPPQSSEEPPSS